MSWPTTRDWKHVFSCAECGISVTVEAQHLRLTYYEKISRRKGRMVCEVACPSCNVKNVLSGDDFSYSFQVEVALRAMPASEDAIWRLLYSPLSRFRKIARVA